MSGALLIRKAMARHQSAFAFLSSRLAKRQLDVHRVEPTNVRKGDSSHPEHCSHSQYLFFRTRACKFCHHSWKHRQFSTKNIFYLLHFPSLYSMSQYLSKSCLSAEVSAYREKTSLLCTHLAPATPPKSVLSIQELHPSLQEYSHWPPPPRISSHIPSLKPLFVSFYVQISLFPSASFAQMVQATYCLVSASPRHNHSPSCAGLKVELGSSVLKQKKYGYHRIFHGRILLQKSEELGALTSSLNPVQCTGKRKGKGFRSEPQCRYTHTMETCKDLPKHVYFHSEIRTNLGA